MEHFKFGLLLMAVGMITVFSILMLVIALGKLLISMVNKYVPEFQTFANRTGHISVPVSEGKTIPEATTAAIVSTVSLLTYGRGKVVRIEKK